MQFESSQYKIVDLFLFASIAFIDGLKMIHESKHLLID